MNLKNWIVHRERIGQPCFSHAEAAAAFPALSPNALDAALSRFRATGLLQPVHRGFYCVVPAHYALAGVIPPFYYVDSLMRWMGRPYYVALLSAAELWGAAHQKVPVTQVMTELPPASTSARKNPSIEWIYRRRVPEAFLARKNGENGPVVYSGAELTALDLVRYAGRAGGLSFVATVLAELAEATDFAGAGDVQRLGYLFGEVLGDGGRAGVIRDELRRTGAALRTVPLRPGPGGAPASGVDRTWRVAINEQIEVDEL